MPMEEWLMNWTNSVYPDRKSKIEKARKLFAEMIDEGYSAIDASEMLIGNGVADEKMSDEILFETFGMKSTGDIKRVPRHYADVKDKVEKIVLSMPSSDVIGLIVGNGRNRFSIGRMSKKETEDFSSLVRMAKAQRGENPMVINAIHSILESHIQNSIMDTEIKAKENISIEWSDDGMTATASDEHGNHRVSLKDDSCTCDRYVLGGFKHLGLMCEHVLEANRIAAGENWGEMTGAKKVFAQSSNDGVRYAWCDRLDREIDISASCKDAECPFFQEDSGDFIRCGFTSR